MTFFLLCANGYVCLFLLSSQRPGKGSADVDLVFSQVPFTYVEYDSGAKLWPGARRAYEAVDRFQLVNSYGLFRRMTGVGGRPEVVIEGSHDRVTWTVREGAVVSTASRFYGCVDCFTLKLNLLSSFGFIFV